MYLVIAVRGSSIRRFERRTETEAQDTMRRLLTFEWSVSVLPPGSWA